MTVYDGTWGQVHLEGTLPPTGRTLTVFATYRFNAGPVKTATKTYTLTGYRGMFDNCI